LATSRKNLHELPAPKQRESLRKLWREKLGDIEPYPGRISNQTSETKAGVRIEKFVMTGERDIRVPVLLLVPPNSTDQKQALAILLAQAGKDRFLKERAETVAALLNQGIAVCLPDLRGMGETQPGSGRSRQSWATSISATELMLGQTLLGSRLKDLRSLLAYLRGREEFDPQRFAVWGDSLAAVNTPDRNLKVPLGIDGMPHPAEPGGPLLALFAGLYEEDLAALILARGGLVSWQSLLDSPFLYVPHDVVVPGGLMVSDLNDIAESLAPKPLWIGGLVDGLNRAVSQDEMDKTYAQAANRYRANHFSERWQLHAGDQDSAGKIVPWLAESINR
jgi:hypothetical protein